ATSAGAGYGAHSRLASQFLLDGVPGQGEDIESLKQALLQQIRELQEKPVTKSELDRVKAQVVAGDVYQRDSVFYQAMQIGTMETIGLGWQILDEYVDQISAVTADQVQEVAKKYLVDDRLTIARLDPQPMDQVKLRKPSKPRAGVTGGRH
ncbi:MAG: insulinase family protein, partial [Gammaproteobacteria bacterium]|nr:insulinase family protein [Gammaproteobacteria bacterium]